MSEDQDMVLSGQGQCAVWIVMDQYLERHDGGERVEDETERCIGRLVKRTLSCVLVACVLSWVEGQ